MLLSFLLGTVSLLVSESAASSIANSRQTVSLSGRFQSHNKKYWGAATDKNRLTSGSAPTIQAQFNQVTAENSFKWEVTEPNRGQFDFTGADYLVNWAVQNNKLIRGHTLVWHSQLAGWVSNIKDNATMTAVITNHVTTMVSRYKGKILHWDVVNEILNEDGSMRPSIFYNISKESFVRTAFEAARIADPAAKLYINDYNLDDPSSAKTKGMIAKVKEWRSQGIPIDGIGSQAHLQQGQGVQNAAALKALSAAAPEVAITELDIVNAPPSDYVAVKNGCLALDNCVGITSWGVRDPDSWRASSSPLLFDANFNPKPAYNALVASL